LVGPGSYENIQDKRNNAVKWSNDNDKHNGNKVKQKKAEEEKEMKLLYDDTLSSSNNRSKRDNVNSFRSLKNSNNKHSNSNKAKSTFIVDLIELINNFVFVNGIIVRAILFGVNTALHFWISDYMRTVLSIQDTKIIFISYTIIAVSGPIGGVLASSIVSTFLGGYEHKNSSYVLLVLHCITCAFGLFIPFMNMLYPFCIMATLYLVFSSAALPIVQGIIITSVDTKLKGTAFSIANLVTMLCTSGPAPVLYGIVNDKYKNVFQGMGMLFIMGCACVGILFIIILCVCRYRKMIRDEKVKKLMEKKKKEQMNDFATDIAGAVNDASLEMNASIEYLKGELR
jgi:MFS family permease